MISVVIPATVELSTYSPRDWRPVKLADWTQILPNLIGRILWFYPPPTPKELFLESLNRCTENERFIPAFYERFLASSEEIRNKFRHTDFERQNKLLLRSLKLAAGATAGEAESLRELRERAETHDRYHLNIEPRLYEFWLDAVIQTARDFDIKWEESVEDAWHTILGYVIKQMIKHY